MYLNLIYVNYSKKKIMVDSFLNSFLRNSRRKSQKATEWSQARSVEVDFKESNDEI